MCGNSADNSKGFFQSGMWKFDSSEVSQGFLRPEVPPLKVRKSPPLARFCNSAPVSELRKWRTRRPFRQKSPATIANIPVLGRHAPETRFDPHCVLKHAVQLDAVSVGEAGQREPARKPTSEF